MVKGTRGKKTAEKERIDLHTNVNGKKETSTWKSYIDSPRDAEEEEENNGTVEIENSAVMKSAHSVQCVKRYVKQGTLNPVWVGKTENSATISLEIIFKETIVVFRKPISPVKYD